MAENWEKYEDRTDEHEFASRMLASPAARVCLLVGPAGSGKSHLARAAADSLGLRSYVVPMTSDTSAADLVGFFMPKGEAGRWEFYRGAALMAFTDGGVLILDDVDRATDELGALAILHHLADEPATARLTLPIPSADGGEVTTVTAHPNFRLVATSNLIDPFKTDPALADRFAMRIPVINVRADLIPTDVAGAAVFGNRGGRAARAFAQLVAAGSTVADAVRAVAPDDYAALAEVIEAAEANLPAPS